MLKWKRRVVYLQWVGLQVVDDAFHRCFTYLHDISKLPLVITLHSRTYYAHIFRERHTEQLRTDICKFRQARSI